MKSLAFDLKVWEYHRTKPVDNIWSRAFIDFLWRIFTLVYRVAAAHACMISQHVEPQAVNINRKGAAHHAAAVTGPCWHGSIIPCCTLSTRCDSLYWRGSLLDFGPWTIDVGQREILRFAAKFSCTSDNPKSSINFRCRSSALSLKCLSFRRNGPRDAS